MTSTILGEKEIVVEEPYRRVIKDNMGVVYLQETDPVRDARVGWHILNKTEPVMVHGLPLSAAMLKFLARDEVHAALKALAEET
jgi:hypothetical protein